MTVDLREDAQKETREPATGQKKKKKKLNVFQKSVIWLFVLIFVYVFYVALDANKYQATVLPVDGEGRVGINPTTEVLDFGDLSGGTSAVRTVTIENGTFLSMYVFALRFGGVGELMKQNKNFFTLAPHASEQIEFEVYMPASAPVGQRMDGRVYLFKLPVPLR